MGLLMPVAAKRTFKRGPLAARFPLPLSGTVACLDYDLRVQNPVEQHHMPRLAIPRRGHVLSTATETFAKPIRDAVAILFNSLSEKECAAIHSTLLQSAHRQAKSNTRSATEMTAWSIVSIWLTAVTTGALRSTASLAEAEAWFFGSDILELARLPSAKDLVKAEALLRAMVDAPACLELLPYILDPHGPGNRLSVRRDPSTQGARSRKRSDGVFYTPADVAEYMSNTCIEELRIKEITIFDPACGTGVFLRAAFKTVRRALPEQSPFVLACDCLFGADIDPWALDAAAFVLLADTWPNFFKMTPAQVWRRLRQNLACIDTLTLDPSTIVTRKRSVSPFEAQKDKSFRLPISQVFPTLARGPTVILGNPPYADLGERADIVELGQTLETIAIKPQSNAEIFIAFVEQMIRLGNRNSCAGAFVLPLSIACNVGSQFDTARQLVGRTLGKWRFAFFDREPHALFGEDVKTRNTIVFWSRTSSDDKTTIATGPLRKWRGDNRSAMFKSLRFTPIDMDIRSGIPKVEGHHQAEAFAVLKARWHRLEYAVESIGKSSLSATVDSGSQSIFVGPTAYNFLNVFLKPQRSLLDATKVLSEHPLHAIRCASAKDAMVVFAILSSHLAYWWWHAHSDGFHVTRRIIAEMPFGMDVFTGAVADDLARCGEELWSATQSHPIISLNAGRTSLAYTPNGHDVVRRKADVALALSAGLSGAFVAELQQFTARCVAATLYETI